MSETKTTQTEPPKRPGPGFSVPFHPAQILLNLIITLLAPMFLSAAGGDIDFARMAAAETVESYRAETEADIIFIAQIIAFGLAALGSLSLSMADDLSLPMILRLRGNANACNRSAQQNRAALRDSRSNTATPATPPLAAPDPEPATNQPATAAPGQATENQAQPAAPSPPSAPIATEIEDDRAAEPIDDAQYQAVWAESAARIAAETTARLAGLPPEERKAAELWITILNDYANQPLTDPPPLPKPGDPDGTTRPDGT